MYIPGSGSASKNSTVFNTKPIKLDLGTCFFPNRIPDLGVKKATLQKTIS
jgi:hypothetical protein